MLSLKEYFYDIYYLFLTERKESKKEKVKSL